MGRPNSKVTDCLRHRQPVNLRKEARYSARVRVDIVSCVTGLPVVYAHVCNPLEAVTPSIGRRRNHGSVPDLRTTRLAHPEFTHRSPVRARVRLRIGDHRPALPLIRGRESGRSSAAYAFVCVGFCSLAQARRDIWSLDLESDVPDQQQSNRPNAEIIRYYTATGSERSNHKIALPCALRRACR